MARVHTHYDNLKVAHNAPIEVIRAAYKTLSQKFHPDRNPGNAEAARIMAIINTSYDVLSDPEKRAAHDRWIAEQERRSNEPDREPTRRPAAQSSTTGQASIRGAGVAGVFTHVLQNWFWYALAGFFVWLVIFDRPSPPPPSPKPYQATAPETTDRAIPRPAAKPAYIRPDVAPNGQPWPTVAAYAKGYQRLHMDGLSTVTVDNSRNDSDVFVKLVSLDGPKAYPVRTFYIPARGTFTLNKVRAGTYDVRYRDLATGALSRSESFELEELEMANGIQFSNLTMTLYKVQHGNMKTYGLSETEF
jgi:curved DNA-binding protein CbpA